ncbi:hypothetical protein ACVGXU_09585, partial [Enterobacter hormaechei]
SYGNLKARHCSHCFQYYFSQLLAGFFFSRFLPFPVGVGLGYGKKIGIVKTTKHSKRNMQLH